MNMSHQDTVKKYQRDFWYRNLLKNQDHKQKQKQRWEKIKERTNKE